MVKDFPKTLIVGIHAMQDDSGINTLIELFKGWDKENLAHIYTKSAMPNTEVCDRFFRISENAVLKSVFNRKIVTGRRVYNDEKISWEEQQAIEDEKKLYTKPRKKQSWFLVMARELVWILGKWKTQALEQFVEEFNPDVLFYTIYPTIYTGIIQNYILKKTKKPAVCYLIDDVYTYKSLVNNPLAYIHRFFLRKIVKKVVSKCEEVFVIAPKTKEECDGIFNISSKVLTKGIDFSHCVKSEKSVAMPIHMVYTGKIIIGRWKALSAIADAMGKINRDNIKILLDIYTTDTLTKQQEKLLNRNGCCVKGAVSQQEVLKVQQEADIVVFVESLDHQYRNIARWSFSTKITDYLKSGKCILAIGDKEIAPVDYFVKNDLAIVVTDYQDIYNELDKLLQNPNKIVEYGEKAYRYGIDNHSKERIFAILKGTLQKVCKSI